MLTSDGPAKENAVENADGIRYAPAPARGGPRLPLGAHPGNTGGKKGRSGRRRADGTVSPRRAWYALSDDEQRAEILRLFDNPEHQAELERLAGET